MGEKTRSALITAINVLSVYRDEENEKVAERLGLTAEEWQRIVKGEII